MWRTWDPSFSTSLFPQPQKNVVLWFYLLRICRLEWTPLLVPWCSQLQCHRRQIPRGRTSLNPSIHRMNWSDSKGSLQVDGLSKLKSFLAQNQTQIHELDGLSPWDHRHDRGTWTGKSHLLAPPMGIYRCSHRPVDYGGWLGITGRTKIFLEQDLQRDCWVLRWAISPDFRTYLYLDWDLGTLLRHSEMARLFRIGIRFQ